MVDTVEAECVSICKNVGIDLFSGDAKTLQSSIRRLIRKDDQKQRQKNKISVSKTQKGQEEEEQDSSRRKSLESNDTGYASDSR